jgi:hypothetical protein
MATQTLSKSSRSKAPARIFFGVVAVGFGFGILFALHMAALAATPHVDQAGGEASLADILVSLLAVSGVTVPMCIVYLTLGKGGDTFCAVAEMIPYFLAEKKYDSGTIKKTYLFWKDRENSGDGRVRNALLTLYEFTKMPSWPSGDHISWDARMHLLTGNTKDRYHYYFEAGEDRHGLMRYAWTVGASAVLCFVAICLIYMRLAGETITFGCNILVVFNAFANVATYLYLILLIMFKSEIRKAAFDQAETFCDDIENDVIAASKQSATRSDRAQQELTEAMRRIREKFTTPKPP